MILNIERNGKKKVRTVAKKPSQKTKEYVVVDYPKSGEMLTAAQYTVRIGASGAAAEISIDGSDWAACRRANGYFWFDWTQIQSGPHAVTARIRTIDGKIKKSKVVKCVKK